MKAMGWEAPARSSQPSRFAIFGSSLGHHGGHNGAVEGAFFTCLLLLHDGLEHILELFPSVVVVRMATLQRK